MNATNVQNLIINAITDYGNSALIFISYVLILTSGLLLFRWFLKMFIVLIKEKNDF